MIGPQVFLRGTTPTLVTYPTLDGMPVPSPATAAEVRVASAAVAWPDEVTGYVAADVDDFDEVVDAEAEEGARFLEVTVAGLVVGRRYLVVDTDGVFAVTCEAITATGFRTGEPLRRFVTDAAHVVGWAVTYQLTADDTEEVGFGSAQFLADVNGMDVSWVEPFRVARRQAVVPLTTPQLIQAYPDIKALIARQDETAEQVIRAAWEHLVLPRVLRAGAYPEDIMHPYVLAPALGVACMLHVARQSRQVETEFVARWAKEFDLEIERAKGRIDWHEAPQVDSPELAPDPLLQRNQTRLVR